MKKIVALVLSLVMVLGLATTAFAAPSYKLDAKKASDLTAGTQDFTATVVAAVPAYINADDAIVSGGVMHYTVGTDKYVPCTADTLDAEVWYYDGTTTVFDTVVKVTETGYYYYGAEYTNFGKACGQLNNEADVAGTKYYTYTDGDGVAHIFQGVTAGTGTTRLLVDGKLVDINGAVDYATRLNAHKWVVEKNAKNEVTAAKCSLCALEATWVLNKASVPTGAIAIPGFGGYLYWNAAPVASEPSTDKVESAQTFDAGIAMYVGMSVMAAAGSAVVLKKKD